MRQFSIKDPVPTPTKMSPALILNFLAARTVFIMSSNLAGLREAMTLGKNTMSSKSFLISSIFIEFQRSWRVMIKLTLRSEKIFLINFVNEIIMGKNAGSPQSISQTLPLFLFSDSAKCFYKKSSLISATLFSSIF